MKYLSVCSGIEAASVAWHPLGWEPVAFAEIEAFPSAVLAHRFPNTLNLGDMTKFKDWPNATVDVLVGGTPCQSFSVAGLRKGLADPRGNLALTYLAIADKYRPEWLLWENVPGVLSSSGGRDFGSFLGGLGQLGYGFAYRVLDAQYVRVDGFGRAVPQRRRRVFVVGHSDWRRAAAVLFDAASLYGDSAPRREAGKRTAPTLAARTRGGGGLGTDFDCDGGLIPSHDVSQPLLAKGNSSHRADAESYVGLIASTGDVAHCLNVGGMGRQDYETETMIAHSLRAEGFDASEDGTGRGTPIVPVAFDARQSDVVIYGDKAGPLDTDGTSQAIAFSCKDHGADAANDVAPTMRAMGFAESHANAGGQLAVAFAQNTRDEVRLFGGDGQTVGALAAEPGMKQTTYVAALQGTLINRGDTAGPAGSGVDDSGSMFTLTKTDVHAIASQWAVRRLTPTECERLQGFPAGWTDVPYRGKPAADGPRYRALGNSMACNVMRWLGRRIDMVREVPNG